MVQEAKAKRQQQTLEFGIELSDCQAAPTSRESSTISTRIIETSGGSTSPAAIKLDIETTTSTFFEQLHAARLQVHTSDTVDTSDPMQVLAFRLFNKS
jgi:hypothetical protein